MMDDQGKLSQYIALAKVIIFNEQRMEQFLRMLATEDGALTAVQTVVTAIDRKRPVPPQIVPLLAATSYMLMVDLAQDITGKKASGEVMRKVMARIMASAIKIASQGVRQKVAKRSAGMIQGVAA